jgi:hypothetical protein
VAMWTEDTDLGSGGRRGRGLCYFEEDLSVAQDAVSLAGDVVCHQEEELSCPDLTERISISGCSFAHLQQVGQEFADFT